MATIKSLAKTYNEASEDILAPNTEEFCAMLKHLGAKWSESELMAIMRVTRLSAWREFCAGVRKPDPLMVRLVWFLYMLDCEPSSLLRTDNIMTWCRFAVKLPTRKDFTAEDRVEVVVNLVRSLKGNRKRVTLWEIANISGVSVALAAYVCAKLGFKVESFNEGELFASTSPWYKIDWAKSNDEIAEAVGVNPSIVRTVRNRLAEKLPLELVVQNFIEAGTSLLFVYPLWPDGYPKSKIIRDRAFELAKEAVKLLNKNNKKVIDSEAEKAFNRAHGSKTFEQKTEGENTLLLSDTSKRGVSEEEAQGGCGHVVSGEPVIDVAAKTGDKHE